MYTYTGLSHLRYFKRHIITYKYINKKPYTAYIQHVMILLNYTRILKISTKSVNSLVQIRIYTYIKYVIT